MVSQTYLYVILAASSKDILQKCFSHMVSHSYLQTPGLRGKTDAPSELVVFGNVVSESHVGNVRLPIKTNMRLSESFALQPEIDMLIALVTHQYSDCLLYTSPSPRDS